VRENDKYIPLLFLCAEGRTGSMGDKDTYNLNDRLFKWLRHQNTPQEEIPRENKVYLSKIAVGWKRLNRECNPKYPDSIGFTGDANKAFQYQVKFNLVDFGYYRMMMQQELSAKFGFGRANRMKCVDFCCIIDGETWVIKGDRTLSKNAIRRINEYYDLFQEDHPEMIVKKGIVCEKSSSKNKDECERNNIVIFSIDCFS